MVSESDGAFSLPIFGTFTYRELHAIEDGMYCGYQGIERADYDQEKHYWRMGYLAGDLILTRFKND